MRRFNELRLGARFRAVLVATLTGLALSPTVLALDVGGVRV